MKKILLIAALLAIPTIACAADTAPTITTNAEAISAVQTNLDPARPPCQ